MSSSVPAVQDPDTNTGDSNDLGTENVPGDYLSEGSQGIPMPATGSAGIMYAQSWDAHSEYVLSSIGYLSTRMDDLNSKLDRSHADSMHTNSMLEAFMSRGNLSQQWQQPYQYPNYANFGYANFQQPIVPPMVNFTASTAATPSGTPIRVQQNFPATPLAPTNPSMGVQTLLRHDEFGRNAPPAPHPNRRSSGAPPVQPPSPSPPVTATYQPPPQRGPRLSQAFSVQQQQERERERTAQAPAVSLIAQPQKFTPGSNWTFFDANNLVLQKAEVAVHYSKLHHEVVVPLRDNFYPPNVQAYIFERLLKAAAEGRISRETFSVDTDITQFQSYEWDTLYPWLELALKPSKQNFESEAVKALTDLVTASGLREKRVIRDMRSGNSTSFHIAFKKFLDKAPVLLRLLAYEDGPSGSNLPRLHEDAGLGRQGLIKLVKGVIPEGVVKALINTKGLATKEYFNSLPNDSTLGAIDQWCKDLIEDEDVHYAREQQFRSTRERQAEIGKHFMKLDSADDSAEATRSRRLSMLNDEVDQASEESQCDSFGCDYSSYQTSSALHAHFNESNPAHHVDNRLGASSKYTSPNPVPSKRLLQEQRPAYSSDAARGSTSGALVDPARPSMNPTAKFDCQYTVMNEHGCAKSDCTSNHTAAAGGRVAREIAAKVFRYSAKNDLPVLDPARWRADLPVADLPTVQLRKPPASALHLASDGIPGQEYLYERVVE